MKLINFNCILVLICEICKIIHLGNSTHRSTDRLLSPRPAAALRPAYLKGSRSQQQRSDLVSAPRSQPPCHSNLAANLNDSRNWTEFLSSKSDKTGMAISGWEDLASARANHRLLTAPKNRVAPNPACSQGRIPAKSVQIQSCLAIWVYFPKCCHKVICFFKSLILFELCISDADIFYI